MNRYEVVFSPEAEEDLAELYRYIEENASADVALRYTSAVVEYCEGLTTFPLRGDTAR
jgi:toxin ParE1/3/4